MGMLFSKNWLLVVVGMFALFLIYSAICFVPPTGSTRVALTSIEMRAKEYYKTHPTDETFRLEDLPQREGYDNSITDGWGHPIIVEKSGLSIKLASYGKDGKPGGEEDDRDIVRHFTIQ